MHDVPQNLLQQIKDFEHMFTVDRAKLKEVVAHFVKELEKGECWQRCLSSHTTWANGYNIQVSLSRAATL